VADFVPTLAYLQLVVTREGHEKFESFGIHILQPAVNDRALDASGDDRFQVRRVVDALVVSERLSNRLDDERGVPRADSVVRPSASRRLMMP